MKVLRWLVAGLGIVAAGVVLVLTAARFGDGPLGPIQGGPFVAGELVSEPVGDWAFVDSVPQVELQLLEPPRSRTVWVVSHAGRAFVPCAAPDFRLWKQWPHQALKDGRGVVRVEGRRYPVHVTRVEDAELRTAVLEKVANKYERDAGFGGEVWVFELGASAS